MLCYVRLASFDGVRKLLLIFILSEIPKMRNKEYKFSDFSFLRF